MPQEMRKVANQQQLILLHGRVDRITLNSGSETTLSRKPQLIVRKVARGLGHSCANLFH